MAVPDPDRRAEMALSLRARNGAGAIAVLDLVCAIVLGFDLLLYGWTFVYTDQNFGEKVGWWGAVAGGVRFFAVAFLVAVYRSIRRGLKEGGPGAQVGLLTGASGALLAGLPPMIAFVVFSWMGPGAGGPGEDAFLAFVVPCTVFIGPVAILLAVGNLYVALRHGPALRAGLSGSFSLARHARGLLADAAAED